MLIRLAVIGLLTFACSFSAVSAARETPNIVFILADDLGIGDVKCYGGERCLIDTPHLDQLAQGGLRFTDAHVNASVCGPTRAAIMTGRYPWRFGPAHPGGAWGFIGPRFDTDTFTLADMLHTAGYRTGYVGKWHLGTTMTTMDGAVQNETNVDFTQPLKVGPPQFGFDDSFILPGSLDMYPYAFARNNRWQGEVTAQKGWSAFNRVGPAEKDFQDHQVLETFYHEAEQFIGRQSSDKPFFLYLALTAPHTPISPGKAWQGRSQLGVYGDFVMEVDHAVERIVNVLKKQQHYDNTLILFSSDHGPASYAGNILKATPGQIHLLEDAGHFPAGPHQGYKFSVYEGGLRVPLIAHWPGVIEPGGRCDALVGLCDLMATLAEVTGGSISAEDAPDSISFAGLLRDPNAAAPRSSLIMQSIGPFVVRDGVWKLCLCPGSGATGRYGNRPAADDAWKTALAAFGRTPDWSDLVNAPFVQLFNVAEDPHEDHNLAAQHPDIVRRMVTLLQGRIESGRSTPGPPLSNDNSTVNIIQRVPKFVRDQLR
ncbi:MAG: arylsulfatase [Fuerstiella sp.]